MVAFMRQQLLGTCVKSFGINHQLLGIDFRNANDDTSRPIAGKLLLEPPRPTAALIAEEAVPLFFYKINLMPITASDYRAEGAVSECEFERRERRGWNTKKVQPAIANGTFHCKPVAATLLLGQVDTRQVEVAALIALVQVSGASGQ